LDPQNRIWLLLARKLAGEASAEELTELQELLQQHPDIAYTAQLMTDYWALEEQKEKTADAPSRLLQRVSEQNPSPVTATKGGGHFPRNSQVLPRRRWAFLYGQGIFRHYFTVAWRNLWQKKAFSLTNITGLAAGMASAILILLWIRHELSYDQFHAKKDRVYQVYNRTVIEGKTEIWGTTPMVLGPVLKQNYPQAEDVVRTNWVAAFVLSVGDKHLESYGYITDTGFFNLFSFPLVKGNAATALHQPYSIVITEKLARKLFGQAEAMGQTIRVDSSAHFTVTAIVKDLPGNTQFDFEYLVPWSYNKEVGWENPSWGFNAVTTYVLLKPGVSEQAANKSFRNITRLHDPKVKNDVFVHPMRKWRLYSSFSNGQVSGGRIDTVRLLGIVAGLILLIACINYMNLSTARSEKRGREVGIRKVAGAGKSWLVAQFLGEALLVAFIAGVLALLMVQLSLPWFGALVEEQLVIPYTSVKGWLMAAAFVLLTGLLAGSYPAFYLSAYKPINILKGYFKTGHARVTPRKLLVVLQFTFAIVFMIATVVIYRQITFIQQRDIGYQQQNLAYVYIKGNMQKLYPVIRNELLASGAVTGITRTNSPVMDVWNVEDDFEWQGKDPGTKPSFIRFHTDNDFASTMGLKIIAGRDINILSHPSDSLAVLINETAARLMGFTQPVGHYIESPAGKWQIVGMIQDFITGSPFEPVHPLVIQGPGRKNWFGTIMLKLNATHTTAENVEKMATVFKKYNPDYPFNCYFADASNAMKLRGEQHTGMMAALFAGLAIFISCLGLFALAAYMAESRIKEIGVRKVLGASVTGIVTLLSKDFLKLVLVSFVIAAPVAWWLMHKWLQDYPYHAGLSWWIFGLCGLLTLLLAAVTVSFQAVKAALANPVKSLRNE
jgi:ABC-type antimicrobial peptide transport system permease subunit